MIKKLFRLALSIGVSFAILALLLQMFTSGLPDQQRPSVLEALQSTTLSLVAAYLALYIVTLFVRAYRYRMLIGMSGETNVPTFGQMALVTGIRNMVVDMLPARLGELGYVGLLNRGYGVKLQHCISSLTVSVALDFVALLVVVILVIAKQLVGADIQGWAIGALFSALVLAGVALIGLFVITPVATTWILKRFPASEPESLWSKTLKLAQDFSDSLESVRHSGHTAQVVLLSVVIRLLKYFGLYLLFRAVANPSFQDLAVLPVEQVIGALIGGEIGASLPIPTFMSFGAYEAGSALIFQLLGVVDQASTVVTMLCVHIWSQVMEYIIGGTLLAVFFLMVRRAKASAGGQSAPSRIKQFGVIAGAGSVLMVGSGFLAYQLWAATKLGSLSAPDAGGISADSDEWRELSKSHVSNLNGFVVFSSNRDGNHDIFKLNLADFELSKLTTHPHTETYPRVSPDGKRVVFSRAHQPWVSQRNTVAWDVYVLDLASMQEVKVGSNGTAPHWVNDQDITYLQDAIRVVRVDVDKLASETIYETGKNNKMPAGAHIQNPDLNPKTGELTFTARQNAIGTNTGHWGTAIAAIDQHKGVYNGCELAWDTTGDSLYQVYPGNGINGSNQIVKVNPETLEQSVLIDLEGEFSHEYWPQDASNGKYMVFGASRGKDEHEHDTQDYEIFLWKVGTDSGKATRLTFHTGNDNWPSVYIAD